MNRKTRVAFYSEKLLGEVGPMTTEQLLGALESCGVYTTRCEIPGILRHHAKKVKKVIVRRYKEPYGNRNINMYFLDGDPREKDIDRNLETEKKIHWSLKYISELDKNGWND